MAATRQQAQHFRGVRRVARFAKDFAIEDDFGIGAEHDGVRHRDDFEQACPGFFPSDPAHVVRGGLARTAHFVHVDVEEAEFDPDLAEQLATAGRLRGEIEHP